MCIQEKINKTQFLKLNLRCKVAVDNPRNYDELFHLFKL